jgi:hypothetical protein
MALEVHTVSYPQEVHREPEIWHIAAEQHSVFLLVTGLLLGAFGATLFSLFDALLQTASVELLWQSLFCLFYLGLAYTLWYLQKPLFFMLTLALFFASFMLAGLPLLQPAIFEVTPLNRLADFIPIMGDAALAPWQMALHYILLPLTGLWLFFHRSLEPLFKPEEEFYEED